MIQDIQKWFNNMKTSRPGLCEDKHFVKCEILFPFWTEFSEETDEQIARRLAAEWNAEESRQAEEKRRQELADQEIAKRLAESGEYSDSGISVPASSGPSQSLPTQPPSYDFATGQNRSDLLIDFESNVR